MESQKLTPAPTEEPTSAAHDDAEGITLLSEDELQFVAAAGFPDNGLAW